MKNVTFWFKSDRSGSKYARMSGMIPVKIPDVTPTPASLAYNQPAELQLLISGRGVGLANVWVSIEVPGLSGEMNTTTISDGTATFAFIPPTTGNIVIKIENNLGQGHFKG